MRNESKNFSEFRANDLMIFDKVLRQHNQVIVHGCMGVGKSTLAWCYAGSTAFNQNYRFVFWINASSGQAIEMGFVTLARKIGISEDPECPQRMAAMAVQWLRDHEDWLLILDDVDDIHLLQGSVDLKPSVRKHVIITTRNPNGRLELGSMPLPALDIRSAQRMLALNVQSGYVKVEDEPSELINELENLPLSIRFARIYMHERLPSLSEFIHLYRQTGLEWCEALIEVPTSVKKTIALLVLQVKDVESIRLLSLLSYLNYDEIGNRIWNRFSGAKSSRPGSSEARSNNVLSPLLSYGLVKHCDTKNVLSVESPVRSIMRALIEHPKSPLEVLPQREKNPGYWIQLALELVYSAYPSQLLENLAENDNLYPVAHSCLRIAEKYDVMTHYAASLQGRVADHLAIRGSYKHACHAYGVALRVQEYLYGVNNLNTVRMIRNLGLTHAKARRYCDALKAFERSLRIVQLSYGLGSDLAAEICLNLGSVYSEMGGYREAISQFETAIDIRATSQTIEFTKLAEAHVGLGDAHLKVGRLELARNSFQRALFLYERVSTDTNLNVLRTKELLGQAYNGLGMHAEAMEIYESVLKLKLRVFGEDHAKVADTVHNLGVVLKDLGEFDKAIENFQRARQMYEKGCPYPDATRIANAVKNLGVVQSQQGNHQEAIQYFEHALQLEIQSGRNELGVASSLNNIGVAYARLGVYQRALTMYEEALGIITRVRGPSHVETGDMIYNLGVSQISLGHPRLAKTHLEQSRRIFVSALGKRHPKYIKVKKLLRSIARQANLGRRIANVRKVGDPGVLDRSRED